MNFTAVAIFVSGVTFAGIAIANDDLERLIEAYRSAQQDPDQIDAAYELASKYVNAHPKDGRAMTYKGSLAAMRARESLLPWRKIRYLNQGTALMDDGVNLVLEDKNLKDSRVEIEVRLVRGVTSGRIPSLFNRGAVARADFKRIVEHPEFGQIAPHHQATAYAWLAVMMKRDSRPEDAQTWLEKGRAVDASMANMVWEKHK